MIGPQIIGEKTNPSSGFLIAAIATGRLFMLPNDGKDGLGVEAAAVAAAAAAAAASRPTALICPPCGIRFSSASTLEAHQKYYCSHRPRLESDAENNDEDEEKSAGGGGGGGSSAGGSGNAKFESRKAYACPHCSYSADKKVSLNRHMRMHASSPVQPIQPTSAMPVGSAQSTGQHNSTVASNGSLNEEAERYCRNCDIRSVLLLTRALLLYDIDIYFRTLFYSTFVKFLVKIFNSREICCLRYYTFYGAIIYHRFPRPTKSR